MPLPFQKLYRWCCNKGASILEFALVAPLLLGLLLSIFYFCYTMLVQHALESGLNTGVARASLDPANTIDWIVQGVNRRSMGLFHIDASHVTVRVYPSIAAAASGTGGVKVTGPLAPGSIVKYTVSYPLTFYTIYGS